LVHSKQFNSIIGTALFGVLFWQVNHQTNSSSTAMVTLFVSTAECFMEVAYDALLVEWDKQQAESR
jgi:hypothetical protein